jgi:plastocyanin
MYTTALLIVGFGVAAYQELAHRHYYKVLGAELLAEEEKAHEFDAEPTAADIYLNDFMYTETITIGDAGFDPATITIKPQTKVMFTGQNDNPHFVQPSQGSPVPKYFEPQLDITKNIIFQTKFDTPGTYQFYDARNPEALIDITVEH